MSGAKDGQFFNRKESDLKNDILELKEHVILRDLPPFSTTPFTFLIHPIFL